ncbi:phosphoethanolamine transferase [Roseateles sp.]|jgi:lipid A ethanolaminephosphotransferase|uniref:phosphoethanolamine transferase n=1 Tax=Roseateles sp. TaxID=1971397 RepID=UPI0037C9D705
MQFLSRRSSSEARAPAEERFTITATVEQVLLLASLFWLLAANRLFFSAALRERSLTDPSAWGFAAALALLLLALHFLLLGLVVNRWTVKPVLALLIVGTAFASFYMQSFGVYLDPSMLRNVLKSDVAEARELLSWPLALHLLLYAGLPLLLLSRLRIRTRPLIKSALWRLGWMALAAAVAVGAMLSVFQPFASMMRNHKEVRYLMTPANYLWSLAAVGAAEAKGAAAPRQPLGLDAQPGASWVTHSKPRLVVLVVGETARAANWGLNGYARQTTPELAALPAVINFPQVTSCGTNTETSLPCMFAPIGRRDYDEARIRGSESLLHLLTRAGVGVHWRDNQSGCKGVCDGLSQDNVIELNPPGLCADGRCMDEGLLLGLEQRLAEAKGTQLLVLHQLGNHGPSYFRRYPPAFARFQPACQSDELRNCSREEVVNAYDNALLYTDHLLAQLIQRLQAKATEVDTAVVYVSDHGESLGEANLFLHGMPYAIAPAVQTQVPMVMWFSPGWQLAGGLDADCLRKRAAQPLTHDHLFHSLMGLLDVRSAVYAPDYDLTRGCLRQPS